MPKTEPHQQWDDFTEWLKVASPKSRIYWVHGKIGAGKTVLMRFLDENFSQQALLTPWAQDVEVVRARYYFWNAGNKLQKSMAGLLRTLLYQIFEQRSDLIKRTLP